MLMALYKPMTMKTLRNIIQLKQLKLWSLIETISNIRAQLLSKFTKLDSKFNTHIIKLDRLVMLLKT